MTDLLASDRPTVAPPALLTTDERAWGNRLAQLHDAFRQELDRVVALVSEARSAAAVGEARAAIAAISLDVLVDGVGEACTALCSSIGGHHRVEDRFMLPELRAADPALAAVVDRVEAEHGVVHDRLRALDEAVVALYDADDAEVPARLTALAAEIAAVDAMLRSHFTYEEQQLAPHLGRQHVII